MKVLWYSIKRSNKPQVWQERIRFEDTNEGYFYDSRCGIYEPYIFVRMADTDFTNILKRLSDRYLSSDVVVDVCIFESYDAFMEEFFTKLL